MLAEIALTHQLPRVLFGEWAIKQRQQLKFIKGDSAHQQHISDNADWVKCVRGMQEVQVKCPRMDEEALRHCCEI